MISIIVPVYNGEKYIDNIFLAFEKQIYKDFEVIFIDDGSTDKTKELLLLNSKKYNFSTVIYSQSNKGVSAARNRGLSLAKGDYICFVDVDDDLNEEYLNTMYSISKKENVQLVICKSTNKKNINKNLPLEFKEYTSLEALKSYLYGDFTSGVWTLMVEHRVITDNKLKFEEGYKYSEDLHMVWRLIANVNKVIVLNAPLYIYNSNEGSAMTKFNKDRMHSIQLMEKLNEYFKINKPDFYQEFRKYGKERIRWSVIWQAADHLNYKSYKTFIKQNNIDYEFNDLKTFPDYRVKVSCQLYNKSKLLFYICIKIATKKSLIKMM